MNTPQNLGKLIQANFNPQPSFAQASEAKPEIPSKKVYGYPYLDKEGISQTIQNAKRYSEEWNTAQEEKSAWIHQMNFEYRKEIQENPHTAEQRILFDDFKKKYKLAKAEPMAYNQKVLEFNREQGTHFLLRTYRTLKNEVAITFSHLVFYYAAQIRDNNARKLNAGVTTAGTLPRMLTNSESLKRYKVDGVPQCPIKNDAILSHIHNLVEAGILINYKSHGRNMGFSVDINPEILAVKDHKNPKTQTPQKQSFINFKTGKHPYSDCITRSYKNKDENKGDAGASPVEGNEPAGSTSATGITNKNTQSEGIPGGNASSEPRKSSQNSKKQEQIHRAPKILTPSDHLEAKIADKWELCTELSLDMHVNHIPIDLKTLHQEARNGTMSQQMFRELLFQEFMKYISRLKKGNQSAAGAFYRAFEELEDKKLITAGNRFFRKEVMLEHYETWLRGVDYAEKNWGEKRNWRFLYINDYLDTTRRDGKEMGFWYVIYKLIPQQEKAKAKRKARRAKKAAESQKRKKKIKAERVEKYGYRSVKPGTNSRSLSDFEKARRAVRKHLLGKMDRNELFRYASYNLNENIVKGLGNLIDSESANLRKFNC